MSDLIIIIGKGEVIEARRVKLLRQVKLLKDNAEHGKRRKCPKLNSTKETTENTPSETNN